MYPVECPFSGFPVTSFSVSVHVSYLLMDPSVQLDHHLPATVSSCDHRLLPTIPFPEVAALPRPLPPLPASPCCPVAPPRSPCRGAPSRGVPHCTRCRCRCAADSNVTCVTSGSRGRPTWRATVASTPTSGRTSAPSASRPSSGGSTCSATSRSTVSAPRRGGRGRGRDTGREGGVPSGPW